MKIMKELPIKCLVWKALDKETKPRLGLIIEASIQVIQVKPGREIIFNAVLNDHEVTLAGHYCRFCYVQVSNFIINETLDY